MTETHDRLLVRFYDVGYRPAKVARMNYDNGDYFSINASDDVKIDSSDAKALDPNQWNIQSSDKDHYIKMSIESNICAISWSTLKMKS